MTSRSWDVAMPEERGQDDRWDAIELIEEPPESARTEHDLVPDTVDHPDGGTIALDVCKKCGAVQPRADGACPGRNYRLDEFVNDGGEGWP